MGDSTEAIEAKVVEIKVSNSEVVQWEEIIMAMEQKRIECSVNRKKTLRARYSYGIIFLLTNLIAWLVRDYGQTAFAKLPCKSRHFLVLN